MADDKFGGKPKTSTPADKRLRENKSPIPLPKPAPKKSSK